MRFFKAMSSSPQSLEFAPGVWRALMEDLRARGNGRRESGAFLLASTKAGDDVVRTWLPYDELEPASFAYAYVRLESATFSKLWDWCGKHDVKVVADVHTHPGSPVQSMSDRAHPMVSLAGHFALIVPWFAQRNPQPIDVSLNVYEGSGNWSSYYRGDAVARIITN